MLAKVKEVVFDCAEPARVAGFWQTMLGGEIKTFDDDPDVHLIPPTGPPIWFVEVPETKTLKNRVHLDLTLASNAAFSELLAHGATIVWPPEEIGERWHVMADPEGNEFCVFPPE